MTTSLLRDLETKLPIKFCKSFTQSRHRSVAGRTTSKSERGWHWAALETKRQKVMIFQSFLFNYNFFIKKLYICMVVFYTDKSSKSQFSHMNINDWLKFQVSNRLSFIRFRHRINFRFNNLLKRSKSPKGEPKPEFLVLCHKLNCNQEARDTNENKKFHML